MHNPVDKDLPPPPEGPPPKGECNCGCRKAGNENELDVPAATKAMTLAAVYWDINGLPTE